MISMVRFIECLLCARYCAEHFTCIIHVIVTVAQRIGSCAILQGRKLRSYGYHRAELGFELRITLIHNTPSSSQTTLGTTPLQPFTLTKSHWLNRYGVCPFYTLSYSILPATP